MDGTAYLTREQEGQSALPTGAAWDFPINIVQWAKNSRETIRISLDSFKGKATINLRIWYADADGQLKPSPKGLTVEIKHITHLADGLAQALESAKSHGLIPEGCADD